MGFGSDESIYLTISQVVTTNSYNTLRLLFELVTLA
jgi:hypothetical protein